MEQTELLDYPFDLYQRTRDIRETIDIIVRESGKKPSRILDIGGFRIDAEARDDLLLREFLPGHDIYCLDLVKSTVSGYIQGDGARLPFKESVFDIVVTSDVYEHVPPGDREKFLQNLVRVVKPGGFVILGAPFYSEKVALAENILFEYIRKVLCTEHEQLKEHIDNRLPDAGELKQWLKRKGMDFIYFECGNLDSWLFMMMVKHYLMSIPDAGRLHAMLDRYYNLGFYESDHQGEGYRKFFVIGKEKVPGNTLKKIGDHFNAYAQDKEYQSHRLAALAGNDSGHVRMLLDLEALQTRARLREKDAIIQHQAAQILACNRMRSTRVYRVIQFFNRIVQSPFLFLGRWWAGKMRQVGQVITGKRRRPLLSISDKAYRRWMKKHEPTDQEIPGLKKEIQSFAIQPKISVVMPVYNVEPQWLRQAIESVFNQVYQNWELCIADDASPAPHIKKILNLFEHRDKRVKIKYLKTNRGISGATNEALSLATGQYVALLDHDDVLSRDSLYEIVKLLNTHPEAELIYTDEDKLTMDGMRRGPVFKPDWHPGLFLTYNYLCHLVVCKKELMDQAGGFRLGFEGSQDYDLLLRVTELTGKIFHIPKVLYHWRMIPGSAASVVDAKPEAFQRTRRALEDALKRRGIRAQVQEGNSKVTF